LTSFNENDAIMRRMIKYDNEKWKLNIKNELYRVYREISLKIKNILYRQKWKRLTKKNEKKMSTQNDDRQKMNQKLKLSILRSHEKISSYANYFVYRNQKKNFIRRKQRFISWTQNLSKKLNIIEQSEKCDERSYWRK
jgi:hypothetical protein